MSYVTGHEYSRLPLKAVTLGDAGTYVVCCDNGSAFWSSSLPVGLFAALKKTSKRKAGFASVSLGRNLGSARYTRAGNPVEVWFLQRSTGCIYLGQVCGSALRKKWRTAAGRDFIERVSFAPDGGWFAVAEHGGATWQGLPKSLDAELQQNSIAEGGVAMLSVGHDGEWFVKYSSGVYAWERVHSTLAELLQSSSSCESVGELKLVELRPDGTYVAVFDYHTAWRGNQCLAEDLLACK